MKETIAWMEGMGSSLLTYHLLQTHIPNFVLDSTAKVVAAIFVGFIGGFMGLLGKKAAEDYLEQRKRKKDAKKKIR